jgi:hypothetical protein
MDQWVEYRSVSPPSTIGRYNTRCQVTWYDMIDGTPCLPPPQPLRPTTVTFSTENHDLFYYVPSSKTFKLVNKPSQTMWQGAVPSFLQDTPVYFQHLLGQIHIYSDEQANIMAQAIQDSVLVACSNESHEALQGTGTSGWVSSDNLDSFRVQSTGPVDCHPSLNSSYRAELTGLLTVTYIIYRICSWRNLAQGMVTIYCDKKGALHNMYTKEFSGVGQFLKPDYDIIQQTKTLLQLIPIRIQAKWVKGHSTSNKKSLQGTLNTLADKLAGQFTKHPPRTYSPTKTPLRPPNYKVRLLYDGSKITTKLYHIISTSLHTPLLRDHIKKKTGWTDYEFNLVDWDNHERAFSRLTRGNKISIAKLIHQLVNTNRQNSLYYGTTKLCPTCNLEEETMHHVLLCGDPRQKA